MLKMEQWSLNLQLFPENHLAMQMVHLADLEMEKIVSFK